MPTQQQAGNVAVGRSQGNVAGGVGQIADSDACVADQCCPAGGGADDDAQIVACGGDRASILGQSKPARSSDAEQRQCAGVGDDVDRAARGNRIGHYRAGREVDKAARRNRAELGPVADRAADSAAGVKVSLADRVVEEFGSVGAQPAAGVLQRNHVGDRGGIGQIEDKVARDRGDADIVVGRSQWIIGQIEQKQRSASQRRADGDFGAFQGDISCRLDAVEHIDPAHTIGVDSHGTARAIGEDRAAGNVGAGGAIAAEQAASYVEQDIPARDQRADIGIAGCIDGEVAGGRIAIGTARGSRQIGRRTADAIDRTASVDRNAAAQAPHVP